MNNADISNLIYGVAVGDAMGFPVQFYKREQVKSFNVTGMITHKGGMFPAGTWSDDTSLTLALADSLSQTEEIDYSDIMKRFYNWISKGEYTPWGKAFDNKDTFDVIHNVSRLTHAHPIALVDCDIYIAVLSALLNGADKLEAMNFAIEKILHYVQADSELKRAFSYYERLTKEDFIKLPESKISSTGYIVDTLETALWCFLTTDSYRKCNFESCKSWQQFLALWQAFIMVIRKNQEYMKIGNVHYKTRGL